MDSGGIFSFGMAAPGNRTAASYPQRKFAEGEKLWVTGLDVQKNDIVFRLYGDPYDGFRYYAELRFPFEKNSTITPDQALAMIAEVLTVEQAAPGAAPAAAQQAVPPVAPPPPPAGNVPLPDIAPPQTISLGQTIDEVVAVFGQPQKIVNLGSKQTYYYKDLKVIFTDGKVSDVQ